MKENNEKIIEMVGGDIYKKKTKKNNAKQNKQKSCRKNELGNWGKNVSVKGIQLFFNSLHYEEEGWSIKRIDKQADGGIFF